MAGGTRGGLGVGAEVEICSCAATSKAIYDKLQPFDGARGKIKAFRSGRGDLMAVVVVAAQSEELAGQQEIPAKALKLTKGE